MAAEIRITIVSNPGLWILYIPYPFIRVHSWKVSIVYLGWLHNMHVAMCKKRYAWPKNTMFSVCPFDHWMDGVKNLACFTISVCARSVKPFYIFPISLLMEIRSVDQHSPHTHTLTRHDQPFWHSTRIHPLFCQIVNSNRSPAGYTIPPTRTHIYSYTLNV